MALGLVGQIIRNKNKNKIKIGFRKTLGDPSMKLTGSAPDRIRFLPISPNQCHIG